MKEHNMKRTIVLLATLLLSFGLIQGQVRNADIDVPTIQDSLRIGVATTLDVSLENDYVLGGMSLGFEVFSPDGASWSWDNVGGLGTVTGCVTLVTSSRMGTGTVFDMTGFLVTEYDVDETGTRDVIMGGGVAMMQGLPAGPLDHLYSYHFTPDGPSLIAEEATTLCFDSTFVPPSGAFVFVDGGGGAANPVTLWPNGGLCIPVTGARNFCPEWNAGIPTTMNVSHCGIGNVTLSATDPDIPPNQIAYGPVTVVGGGGTATIGSTSGVLTYTPVPADIGASITLEVQISDAYHPLPNECDIHVVTVNVTNNSPTITCGAGYNPVGKGNTIVKTDIHGNDADGTCDVLTYAMVSGPGDIDMVSGVYTWATTDLDVGTHTVCVSVTDGYDIAECCFEVDVLPVEPWEIAIEKAHEVLQGHYVDLRVCINKGSELLGGFDFLIGYDASALAFTEASLGEWLVACGWEFFTYRYNWNGNCGNACPSGLLRVVGMAETNNGPNHPDWDCLTQYERGEDCYECGTPIVYLTFFVSGDRTLECMFVPVRWYWMDCGDNTISVPSGDTLAINRYIYDIGSCSYTEFQDYEFGLPGYYGAPDDPCLEGDKVTPVRFIDFCNGGIDIVCADSIDKRGDINVNGVANEIADAVMFTNYFISGLSAFGNHVESSIASSDVNADGLALSVADLVYLVRVIIGDANPYPKPIPETPVTISARGGAVTYDSPVDIGAALLTFQVNGDVGRPQLGNGASTMDMKYAVEGNEMRVLVYNIGPEMIAAGENELVRITGNVELIGAEVATYDGFGIDALVRNLPQTFSVTNYPNPFNPSTKICLALPEASAWTVKIYNVAGQLVNEFSDYSEAGTVEVMWNGTDNSGSAVASGIYFYKAQAGQYTATRKMILMK
jgi:hypothetical protein